MSLNAGLKLGGAPIVSGSAPTGFAAPTMTMSPMIAMVNILNVRLSTPYPRESVSCVNYALLPRCRATLEIGATRGSRLAFVMFSHRPARHGESRWTSRRSGCFSLHPLGKFSSDEGRATRHRSKTNETPVFYQSGFRLNTTSERCHETRSFILGSFHGVARSVVASD